MADLMNQQALSSPSGSGFIKSSVKQYQGSSGSTSLLGKQVHELPNEGANSTPLNTQEVFLPFGFRLLQAVL